MKINYLFLFVFLNLCTLQAQDQINQDIVIDYSKGEDNKTTPIYTDIYAEISNNFYRDWDQFTENSKDMTPEEKSQEIQKIFGPIAPVDHSSISQNEFNDNYWNLSAGVHPMPDGLEGWGYLLQGFNHSDNLDFGLAVPLELSEVLVDGQSYRVSIETVLAGNSKSLSLGVGGGNTVNLGAVITDMNPRTFDFSDGLHAKADPINSKLFFSNGVGIGSNSICIDQKINLPMVKNCSDLPKNADGQLLFQIKTTPVGRSYPITFDKTKKYWLYVKGHSGFEGFSSFYIQKMTLKFN